MLRDEAVRRVQIILGFRSDLNTEIEDAMRFHQEELENSPELPFFLRKETLVLASTIDDEVLATPTDFLKEWEEDGLWVQVTEDGIQKWRPLEKDGTRYLRESINNLYSDPDTTARIPQAYSFDGVNFRLFPTPDSVYTLRMIYYGRDVPLTSNIENLWLKNLPYLLIGRAGAEIASSGFGNEKALAVFANLISEGTVRLHALTVSRDGAARKYVVGGPDF